MKAYVCDGKVYVCDEERWVTINGRHVLIKNSLSFSQKDNIILKRVASRRDKNPGVFAGLEIPMQKRWVKRICEKYGINLNGFTVKIQRDPYLLSTNLYGSTDYDNIGRFDLFPNAFTNEEELVRTVIHEICHVKQLRKYGKKYCLDPKNTKRLEDEAIRFEEMFYKKAKGRKK